MDWPRLQVSRGQSEHLCCCSESSTEAIFLQSSPLASRCLVTRWWKTLMVCPNLLSVKKTQRQYKFPISWKSNEAIKGNFFAEQTTSHPEFILNRSSNVVHWFYVALALRAFPKWHFRRPSYSDGQRYAFMLNTSPSSSIIQKQFQIIFHRLHVETEATFQGAFLSFSGTFSSE